MVMHYKPSYYNLVVPHGRWTLLFNGVSSGLMRLPPDLFQPLLPFLGPPRPRAAGYGYSEWQGPTFKREDMPTVLTPHFDALLRGHFFLPSEVDEVSDLKRRYQYCRRQSPFLVTITTTMDCNLGCYYCYEDKSKVYLSRDGCDQILAWVIDQIEQKEHKKLYTDWYGGEPMLNQSAIDYFSERVILYCDSHGIGYSSAMISNGTRWPMDASGFVIKNRIRHVQFTLDGPREQHDKRRRYVTKDADSTSSFDAIGATIDRLLGTLHIYLRINVDPWVGRDALALVDYFAERGWLAEGTRFYPYLAAIGPMTEHCAFLGASKKVRDFQQEFDELNHEFQIALARHIDAREIQHLQYYPMTVKINCAAVGDHSVVFGPDGLMYKCGLDVGDGHRAHDRLGPKAPTPVGKVELPILNDGNQTRPLSPRRWEEYDPFSHPRCSQCQYLPVCMGGCPKAQMEGDDYYLQLQSKYWEDNFDRVIRTYYDATMHGD